MSTDAAAEEQLALLVALFATRPGVTPPDPAKRSFGANSLRVDGKIFALVPKFGGLTFKLPRETVAELVGAGEGVRFDPTRSRPLKEWFVLSPESALDPVELAEAAFAYVRDV
ncbi:hypothetical protein [Gryllotalpicola ginsengisoli]|uniref:hypothetical protein n=1 Tax=Gryllotalpicola ginsengisoli TaxID=444608 RepID=UPI0003B6A4B7|nr:hypothetical protein [Gryllotalpicola ginsengisoli]